MTDDRGRNEFFLSSGVCPLSSDISFLDADLLFDRVKRMRNAICRIAEEVVWWMRGRFNCEKRRPLCGAACPCTE